MLNFRGVQTDVILAPYTTYKVGGPADYFYIAKNKKDFIDVINQSRKSNTKFFILGTGANILIGDKGFRGLVIKNETSEVVFEEVGDDKVKITVSSGALISDLIRETQSRGLSGFEHFAGIPSTVGGAIWQNLHFLSPDRTKTLYIDSVVQEAEIIDEEGRVLRVDKDFFDFGYDHSVLHDRNLIVTEVTFILEKSDPKMIQNQIDENLKWRKEKQPPVEEFPSCGTVFKKIADIGAGRLIQEVGLKGHQIGGAKISDKHANFIVNMGGARAEDVCSLIRLVQDTVLKKTGHRLETEIGMIGEF